MEYCRTRCPRIVLKFGRKINFLSFHTFYIGISYVPYYFLLSSFSPPTCPNKKVDDVRQKINDSDNKILGCVKEFTTTKDNYKQQRQQTREQYDNGHSVFGGVRTWSRVPEKTVRHQLVCPGNPHSDGMHERTTLQGSTQPKLEDQNYQ